MWRIPLSLIAGGGATTLVFTEDELIGDLYSYLGSPSSPKDWTIIADGANLGDIDISASFPGASTFQFTAINGGRFIGLGGVGGDGGDDFGTTGSAGIDGGNGGPGISSSLDINIDVDDGFLLGGGGGGGGGSYNSGDSGTPGGGGGGGAGFSETTGGMEGTGSPAGIAGTNGDINGPGVGGNGGSAGVNDGGDGGDFGWGGVTGRSTNLITAFWKHYGGVGGIAGEAFFPRSGATVTFNGVKSEATLRSEDRVKGETTNIYLNMSARRMTDVSVSGASTHGYSFQSDGDLILVNSDAGNSSISSEWLKIVGTGNGDDYELRPRNLTGDTDGTWTATPTVGVWSALTSTRTLTITSTAGIESAAQLIEIRRVDANATTDQVMASMYVAARDENGV